MVLVDTTIWSLALRRRTARLNASELKLVEAWAALVESGLAALIGPIRQEILSGIRREAVFDLIRDHLGDFAILPIEAGDYDEAARFYSVCRSRGISGTSIDMLICAVASRHDVAIFTTDTDFDRYARCLPIRLYEPG